MKRSVITKIAVILVFAVIAVTVAFLLFRFSGDINFGTDTTEAGGTGSVNSFNISEKRPEDYTWEEYLALSNSDKELFYESFENSEEFDKWIAKAQYDSLPWNNGGKNPADYTWEEYLALSNSEKEMFCESFENTDEFEKWMTNAQNNALPWNNNGKDPGDYTWEEYLALSNSEKEMFVESFDNAEDFEAWLEQNQPG